MTRYAIVADLNRCVGCQTCTSACKHANATAPGIEWRKVLDFEVGEFPDVRRAFLPVGCMHCDEPPCLDVCPSTATLKRADGIVTIDYDICIGCAYCAVACPYQARFRVDKPSAAYGGKPMRHEAQREDPRRISVAQKCTFCVDKIDAGLAAGLTPGTDADATPACVNSCIANALSFGDIEDAESNVSILLRENRHFRMHEDLGTGPGIYYLYDGDTGGHQAIDPTPTTATATAPPMVAEPAGLGRVSPVLQTSWDWRAAGNFIFGGTGAGLMASAVLMGFLAPTIWLGLFVALAFTGAGLFCVWLEIGRPWRFLNVFRHPARSWMTREALIALPYFAFGGLGWLLHSPTLGVLAVLSGLAFVYAQGRILRAARGIPAWRQKEIVPLIVVTGLTEGAGLFSLFALFGGFGTYQLNILTTALFVLVVIRFLLWRRYRSALGRIGAPVGALRAFDALQPGLSGGNQGVLLALLAAALVYPVALPVAGLISLVTGWGFKFGLITRAAFNQGYAINRMPARGAGASAPGIKPGWKRA